MPGVAESPPRVGLSPVLLSLAPVSVLQLLSPVCVGVLVLQSVPPILTIVNLPLKNQLPRIELLQQSQPAVPRSRSLIWLAQDDQTIKVLTDIDDLHWSFEYRDLERSDLVASESGRRLEDLVRVPELGSECRR